MKTSILACLVGVLTDVSSLSLSGTRPSLSRSSLVHATNGPADLHSSYPMLPDPSDPSYNVRRSTQPDATRIVVNGAPVKLHELGPVVVGVDGSLGAIDNWKDLTESQQSALLIKIGRRNQDRLAALRNVQVEK